MLRGIEIIISTHISGQYFSRDRRMLDALLQHESKISAWLTAQGNASELPIIEDLFGALLDSYCIVTDEDMIVAAYNCLKSIVCDGIAVVYRPSSEKSSDGFMLEIMRIIANTEGIEIKLINGIVEFRRLEVILPDLKTRKLGVLDDVIYTGHLKETQLHEISQTAPGMGIELHVAACTEYGRQQILNEWNRMKLPPGSSLIVEAKNIVPHITNTSDEVLNTLIEVFGRELLARFFCWTSRCVPDLRSRNYSMTDFLERDFRDYSIDDRLIAKIQACYQTMFTIAEPVV